ncbi:MAG: tetratricopeptide repeat protein [Planctomycetes bacterium]|nr:tetratricopeptide repeat protein [Planctomycetota bacterium]
MGRYAMLVPCALAGALACAPAGADEPPKKLTAEGRKQLERKWKEASDGGAKAREAGKYADATTALADALTAARRLYNQTEFPDGHTNLVSSLENLSDLYEDQGLYTDAEPLRKAATEMRRRLFKGDHQDVALGLNRLAVLYLYQGRYAEAEPLLKDVLEMYRRLHKGDHLNVAGSLNNLATTYSLQGKPTEAEPLLHEVLEMYKRMSNGDHRDVALCLNNLAGMYALQKRYAKAESSARAALEMQKRLFKGDNPEVARSLSMLGAVHMVQGNYAEAERHLKGAAEMLKRLHKGDHPELAHCLSNLGESYLDWGKYADAEKLFKDGLGMMRRLSKSDHPYTAYYLKSCAELYRCQGDYVRAENYFTEALEMARRLGTKFAQEKTEGEALTLLASQPTARDGLITTCLVRGGAPAPLYFQVWADKGFIARVYERRQQRARAATDPKATQALAELADVRRRRAELLLAPATSDPATLTKRREDIKGYEERIEQRAGELKELLPVIERAEKLAAATPTELQKVLPADVAVVDFLRFVRSEQDKDKPGKGGEARVARYLAFVVTKNRVAWVDLDEAAKIEPAIDAWRAAITGGKEIPPALPAKVRELVWDKVRRELPAGTKTVYVSPDAALCRLPFAALPGDEPGTVLLEDLALATVPHAPFLLDKLWPQDPLKNPPAGALVVGGVNYDAGPAPAAPARRGDPLIKPGAKLTWGALPATVGEADGVADAAARRKFTATRLDGAAATPRRPPRYSRRFRGRGTLTSRRTGSSPTRRSAPSSSSTRGTTNCAGASASGRRSTAPW